MHMTSHNVPTALEDLSWRLKTSAVQEASRNGDVLTLPYPLLLTIQNPTQRVVLCPKRDANPFFHVAETVWMFGGSQGVEFLTLFNKRMSEYSDDGVTFHGAYGHRWRHHFYRDQIADVIEQLAADPTTRRAVISMWDAEVDGVGNSKDYPCNTHVYFRVLSGALTMTVCNRSNDIVWGMLGANTVHLTYLHELIARAIGQPVGPYHVLTNNPHTYLANPFTEQLLGLYAATDGYTSRGLTPYPLLAPDEDYSVLLNDCKRAVMQPRDSTFKSSWMREVYGPIRDLWFGRRRNAPGWAQHLERVRATDWRAACQEWIERRGGKSEH
jgi:hypothetical protein